MKITIEAEPKEIAALVAALQERQDRDEIKLSIDWNPGDLVLDPFGGLATVAREAVKLGRKGYTYTGGFEAQHYCRREDMSAPCKIDGLTYPNQHCGGCTLRAARQVQKIEILTTCFEVKISVSDFKSDNGHNFCGNHNYYVVPIDICEKILPLVPDGIGVIAYYPESGRMVEKRRSGRHELDSELLARLLYDALKKWIDRCGVDYGKEAANE